MLQRFIIFISLFLSFTSTLDAQVDAQLSQYWAMPTYYNAGAAGWTDKLYINAASRQQWIGMPGAPKTFLLGADMPFRFLKQNHGVGLQISTEDIGLYTNMTIALQYAFKVKVWKGTLSLGVGLGIIDQRFDGTKIEIPESDYHNGISDDIPQGELQDMGFDADFGIYYTHPRFFAGISAKHLTQPTLTFEDKYETYIGSNYYFSAGGNIPFRNPLYELLPSIFVKTNFQITQTELTARVRYNKFLSAGISYRWKDALVVMIGAEIKNFVFGYAYDYPVSAIVKASSGSHEVYLGYSLKIDFSDKNKNKHKSIRIL